MILTATVDNFLQQKTRIFGFYISNACVLFKFGVVDLFLHLLPPFYEWHYEDKRIQTKNNLTIKS